MENIIFYWNFIFDWDLSRHEREEREMDVTGNCGWTQSAIVELTLIRLALHNLDQVWST